MKPLRAGLIGCGRICRSYIEPLRAHFSHLVEIAACADIHRPAAEEVAAGYDIPRVCSTDEICADPGIDMVINLTVPKAHHPVTMAALKGGKHVFTEKPLGVSMIEALEIVAAAHAGALQVAGAADTFLGAGLQTSRRLLDEGRIGTPVAATAFVGLRPQSSRYYQPGIGPLWDMGPYHITALVALFGPVRHLVALTQVPVPERSYFDSRQKQEIRFSVQTPSNIGAVLGFDGGKHATLTASGEVQPYVSHLTVSGTEGVLTVNDPNHYSGPLQIIDADKNRHDCAPAGYGEKGRGLGVAELAHAIRTGRPAAAGSDLLLHVTEVMEAILVSGQDARAVAIRQRCVKPEPFDIASLEPKGAKVGAA